VEEKSTFLTKVLFFGRVFCWLERVNMENEKLMAAGTLLAKPSLGRSLKAAVLIGEWPLANFER